MSRHNDSTDKDRAKPADANADAPAEVPPVSETVPGGRYVTSDGITRNAEGQELDKRGNVKE